MNSEAMPCNDNITVKKEIVDDDLLPNAMYLPNPENPPTKVKDEFSSTHNLDAHIVKDEIPHQICSFPELVTEELDIKNENFVGESETTYKFDSFEMLTDEIPASVSSTGSEMPSPHDLPTALEASSVFKPSFSWIAMDSRRRKIIVLALLRHRRKKKRHRQVWVHPLLEKRYQLGTFKVLFQELREDDAKFSNYFRMSIPTFDELLQRLRKQLQKQDTNMRNCIQPVEMLAVTLRYLASGCSFTDLHYSYRMGISTISQIVREVCGSIWSCLAGEFIPKLTTESCESVAAGFEKRANFPHCIGAVVGKHIRIVKPKFKAVNYKSYFSVVLMAVADCNYRFIYVDTGAYENEWDTTIFKESSLWKLIQEKRLELPSERPLPGSDGPNVPYFLVGDEAFALNANLLRPFGGRALAEKKKAFNYRLGRARRCIEGTFGILTNKWEIFHRPLNVNTDFAVDIVKACIVLHNFVREKDGYNFEDTLTVVGLSDLPKHDRTQGGKTANSIRNVMADYFLTEAGSVPWQQGKI